MKFAVVLLSLSLPAAASDLSQMLDCHRALGRQFSNGRIYDPTHHKDEDKEPIPYFIMADSENAN